MSHRHQQNYLRTHRRRLAFSQQDMAFLLGLREKSTVHRHENAEQLPGLKAVLAYEIIFGVPVQELFRGQYERIQAEIRERLTSLQAGKIVGARKSYKQKALLRILNRCGKGAQ